jgi:hypothetical protein
MDTYQLSVYTEIKKGEGRERVGFLPVVVVVVVVVALLMLYGCDDECRVTCRAEAGKNAL